MRHEALLWKPVKGKLLECFLCAHRCKIPEEAFGFCGMRQNIDGKLFTFAYGNVIASHVDPIEKKPLYHFLPGSTSYSIATIGCNFRCGFCQNWTISQVSQKKDAVEGYELKPEEVVREALKTDCASISYTYTEPTIFFEYAYDISVIARQKGIFNVFVTNGYMTKEAIDAIAPYLDAANVDLKFFSDASYEKICKGSLQPVLESIRYLREKGVWVEVTTLVIPGQNDTDKELAGIAGFLSGISEEIPWHISRFHPDYEFTGTGPTPVKTLERAQRIGKESGLKYIYLGNVQPGNDTVCPKCGAVMFERSGFAAVKTSFLNEDGKCVKCGAGIPGIWNKKGISA